MASTTESAGTGPPQLASHVDSFDAPLRFLIAIAARAAAATRLPANASISAEDIDVVAEGLSAFSLNEAKEAAKARPLASIAADTKERPASHDEKEAPLAGDGDDVKEVDVAEVQAQAREIAAAQAPQVSEEDMREEREKQRRTLQVVVSQNSAAAQERKQAAREWADEIARHCKLGE